MTLEELREKANAKRAERGLPPLENRAAAPASSTSDPVVEVTPECRDCGETFDATAIVMPNGSLFGVPKRCAGCMEARERREREREERERREREERARSERADKLLDLLHRAGVNPWEHGRCTLANYDATESGAKPVAAVHEWLAEVRAADRYDPVRGLYLFGDTGAGKTHLAAAAARELLADPSFPANGVVFDHALSLITRIQDTYNTGESTEAIIDRRIKAPVWILDDLGTEKPSDDVVRRLTLIFTERARRPTVVTSNLTPDALEKRHPEFYRLQSRLGPAYFRTVKVVGRDRRFDQPERVA